LSLDLFDNDQPPPSEKNRKFCSKTAGDATGVEKGTTEKCIQDQLCLSESKTTAPSFMTNRMPLSRSKSANELPSMTIKLAILPFSSVPIRCRYQKLYPLPLSRGQPVGSVWKMMQVNRLRNFPPPKTICVCIANECRELHGDRRSRG
jgi:hypothetical protein